jgi:hypothetical protein
MPIMGFDDEVDQLKRELQTPKMDAVGRKAATEALLGKLREQIQSRRLEFGLTDGAEPTITLTHTPTKEKLASITVNEDGSVTFQAVVPEEPAIDDVDDAGYFPPYVEYYDQEEFLEEAPEMLKQGIAEFELDLEEDD